MSKILNKVLNIKELEGLENFVHNPKCDNEDSRKAPECCSFHEGAIANKVGGIWVDKATATQAMNDGTKTLSADPDLPYAKPADLRWVCHEDKPTCVGKKGVRWGQCVKLPEKRRLYRNERINKYEEGRVESLIWWNSKLVTPVYFLILALIVIKLFLSVNYFVNKSWYMRILFKLLLITPLILHYFFSYNVVIYIISVLSSVKSTLYNILPIDFFNYELNLPHFDQMWFNPITEETINEPN